jgi:hypothetical protein
LKSGSANPGFLMPESRRTSLAEATIDSRVEGGHTVDPVVI